MSDIRRKQNIRLRHTLLATAGALVLTIIAVYGFYSNYFIFSKDVLIVSLVFLWWGNLGFITAIISGFNERFKDPSLSFSQMIWGTLTSFFYFCSLTDIYLIIYLLIFLTLVFGALRLTVREFQIYCWFTICAALVCLYLRHAVLGFEKNDYDAVLGTCVFMFVSYALTQLCVSLARLRDRLREKNMMLNEAMSAKDTFLANISHEVRTPINGIIGMLDAMQRTSQTHTQKQYTRVAQSSANMLLAIVNDILDLSKIQAGKMAIETLEFNLAQELDPLFDDFAFRAEQKKLTLLIEYDIHIPPYLRGDPVRIKQILSNLLSNAIKFTDQGNIRIAIHVQEKFGDEWVLKFSISDTGIGIEQEKTDALFDSFTQVDESTTRLYGGTGLGLAICRQLCQIMGGDIELKSRYGEGSTFTFSLPFQAALNELNTDKPTIPKRNTNPKLDVVVIDTNDSRSEHFVNTLNDLNFPAKRQKNIHELVEHIETGAWQKGRKYIVILSQDNGLGDEQETKYQTKLLNIKARIKDLGFDALWVRLDSTFQMPDIQILLSDGFDKFLNLPIRSYTLFEDIQSLFTKTAPNTDTLSKVEDHEAIELNTSYQGKLLLVEDNKINQQVALLTLHGLGYKVDVVDNGQQALDALVDTQHGYDLVLMDCQMPVMDGYQATEAVRSREHHEGLKPLPIVAMTANASPKDVQRCLASGMNAHIAKPFQQKTVADVLVHYVKKDVGYAENPIIENSSTSVWDKQALTQRIGENPQQLSVLLRLYLENANENFGKLEQAIQQNDWPHATALAHTLKGTSGNINASHFQGTITLLETALEAKREDHTQTHFVAASEAWHTLKQTIERYLARQST